MVADLTCSDTNMVYHLRGEMFVCPYTDKTIDHFKVNPQYNGLVAHILLTYSIGSSEKVQHVSFYYNPLEEKFLDEDSFEVLHDEHTSEVFLTMKSRRVLSEKKPLCYIPNVADVIQGPDALAFFADLFLRKIF